MHWLTEPSSKQNLQIKLRHGPELIDVYISYKKDGLHIKLEKADSGIAAGQSVIIYDEDICLGSARIN